MSVSQFFRRMLLVDLIKGLSVTFRYQQPKHIYTE